MAEEGNEMSKVWNTEYGPRRVRKEPPSLDEAIFAASGLTDDPDEQAAIAASLMDVPLETVKVAMLKNRQRKDVTRVSVTGRTGLAREVVVERRPARRSGARLISR